ncbi:MULTISPECIES: hypothetical protein [unclassified Mesobacillus]|uniref:hypothetical protein n=1 Tax=unclassified Mesobacillus TaxID=2675270 RepID=UPI00203CB1EF|nr:MULTISPECIES: hypothetical protein [unclassified Mesobacillus]MCM3122747.1 hypothetical protein [Mesobacillus sp. MER 33]MCM3232711.1 hypothetical protein [Mesobacillus sp. MER 48]
MRTADQLSEDQTQQHNRLRSKQKKPPNEMTRKDWEDIMGMNMDTYKRVRGAVLPESNILQITGNW